MDLTLVRTPSEPRALGGQMTEKLDYDTVTVGPYGSYDAQVAAAMMRISFVGTKGMRMLMSTIENIKTKYCLQPRQGVLPIVLVAD